MNRYSSYTNDNQTTVDSNLVSFTDIIPDADNARNLGSSSRRFANFYLAGVGYLSATSNQLRFGAGSNLTTCTFPASSGSATLTFPNATTTLVGTDTVNTLTNKTLTAPIISTISNTGTLTLPTSTTTLIGTDTVNTLTNKTLTQPNISQIRNTGLLTLPTATTTLVGIDTSDTLTNKTLTAPVISTITNTGTLTLPTTTTTLVGRTTSDTLTNKTLTAPVISTISNTGTLTLPTSTTTLIGTDTTDSLSNKSFTNVATFKSASNQITIQPNGSGNSFTINATNPAASRVFTLQDVASSNFVMSEGAQTINGVKTFNNGISTGNISLTTNDINITTSFKLQLTAATTIRCSAQTIFEQTTNQLALGVFAGPNIIVNAPAPSASRIYSLPDAGANSSFVLTDGSQTLNSKTLSSPTVSGALTFSGTKSGTSAIGTTTFNAAAGKIQFTGIADNLSSGSSLTLDINNSFATSSSVCVIAITDFGNATVGSTIFLYSTDLSTNGLMRLKVANPSSTGTGTNWNLKFQFILL